MFFVSCYHLLSFSFFFFVLFHFSQPPFYSRDTAEMYDNILHKPLKLRSSFSPSARSILEGVSVSSHHVLHMDITCTVQGYHMHSTCISHGYHMAIKCIKAFHQGGVELPVLTLMYCVAEKKTQQKNIFLQHSKIKTPHALYN